MCFNVFLIIGRTDSSYLPGRPGNPPPPPHRSRSGRGGGRRSSRCPRWGAPRAPYPRTAAASPRAAVGFGRRSQKEAQEDEGSPSGWGSQRLRQPQPPQHQLQFYQPQHPESARDAAAGGPAVLRSIWERGRRGRERGREGQGRQGRREEGRKGSRGGRRRG